MIDVSINGQSRCFERPVSVAEMLAVQGWLNRRVAVERNGAVVPRSQHDKVMLESGDTLEIIVAVGGG